MKIALLPSVRTQDIWGRAPQSGAGQVGVATNRSSTSGVAWYANSGVPNERLERSGAFRAAVVRAASAVRSAPERYSAAATK